MNVANLTAPPMEAWALTRSVWFPFQLAAPTFAATLITVFIIPGSRKTRTVESSTQRTNGETQILLNDSTDETLLRPTSCPPIHTNYLGTWIQTAITGGFKLALIMVLTAYPYYCTVRMPQAPVLSRVYIIHVYLGISGFTHIHGRSHDGSPHDECVAFFALYVER